MSFLATRVELRGKLNILDLHILSEGFYMDLLNTVFDWKLINLNSIDQNAASIDLIDNESKIVIQVSATSTKNKVESALAKKIMSEYSDYNFKFLSISKDSSNLRSMKISNPHGLIFNPAEDIMDVASLLRVIINHDLLKQEKIYDQLKSELGENIDFVKMESDLTKILKILGKENLKDAQDVTNLNVFQIDKKIEFNNLRINKSKINEYKIYHNRLDRKYTEFDQQGSNLSLTVLGRLNDIYIKLLIENENEKQDLIFIKLIQQIVDQVLKDNNYGEMSYEMVTYCVNILVVDAFIRCKIFENPEGYRYVTS